MEINFNLQGPNVANAIATPDDCDLLFGDAKVYGTAWASGNAKVFGNTEIF